MAFALFADLVVIIHAFFIFFVVVGAIMVVRWPSLLLFHVGAVLWGAWVELAGWTCPLTPLENWARHRAQGHGYTGGFIDYYLLHVIYPTGLTREIQVVLGVALLLLNTVAYTIVIRSRRRRRPNA